MTMRAVAKLCGATAALLVLAACGMPAALDPKGPEASALSNLIWFFTWLCGIIWLLVVIALVVALARRHRQRPDPIAVNPAVERRVDTIVATLAVLTGVIVIGLTVISYATQQQLFGNGKDGLSLDIIGHQWWWEIRYNDPSPARTFTTTNEIHVPVGTPVRLSLTSTDVIHSFWVPSLMGKADLIPGRQNTLTFTVGKPGVYNGQCAEFCGLQHAHMGMRIVADAPKDFEAWRNAQIAAAPPPANTEQQLGQQAFMASPCVSCHSIRGTPAGGTFGPDLTHLASRTTLAAGTAPLNRGTLAAWIADPQTMKPGVDMPTMKLEPDDLEHIVDYLMGLK